MDYPPSTAYWNYNFGYNKLFHFRIKQMSFYGITSELCFGENSLFRCRVKPIPTPFFSHIRTISSFSELSLRKTKNYTN